MDGIEAGGNLETCGADKGGKHDRQLEHGKGGPNTVPRSNPERQELKAHEP